MATPYQLLVAEIDRVVSSPYPTQLKTLHDILVSKCTSDDVSRWARSRPCQVSRLALCICDALGQWPYVLSIITLVSPSVALRDAILELQPGLLNDLVGHAMRHADLDSRYTAAVSAILSHPLPQDVSVPSEIQGLFVRLLDHAAREPSTKTLKPAFCILNGTSNALVDLASDHTISRLEDHFFSMLKNSKNADDQNLSLYCLAMMSELVAASERPRSTSASFFDTQDFLASTPSSQARWNPEGMNQFFVGNKAGKTLHLVALRALWACRSSVDEGLEEVLESLHLANKVALAVSRPARLAWAQANPVILRKLQDKALSEDVDSRISTATIAFVGKICDADMIAPSIYDRVQQLVSRPWRMSEYSLSHDQEYLLEQFTAVLDEDLVKQIMLHMVDYLNQAGMSEVVEASAACTTVLRALIRMLDQYQTVSNGCLAFLQDARSIERLTSLTTRLAYTADASISTGLCASAAMQCLQDVTRNLSELCIHSVMQSTGHRVSAAVSDHLINLLRSSAARTDSCNHAEPRTLFTKELTFDHERSLDNALPTDWRVALETRVAQRVRAEHEDLRQLFTSACAELEERCENVEGPLAKERERCQSLEKQLQDLEAVYRELESRSVDSDIRCNALEAEKDELVAEVESAHDENRNLMLRNETLKQEVCKAQEELSTKASEQQRGQEAMELERDAMLARQQAEADDLEDQLSNAREELRQAMQEAETTKAELDKANAEVARAQAELESLGFRKEEQNAQLENADKRCEVLRKANERLEAELKATKEHAETASREHHNQCQDLHREAEEEARDMRTSHAAELAEIEKQHRHELQQTERQYVDLQAEFKQDHEQLSTHIAALDSKIAGHQKRIDHLTNKCKQKDEQIVQANAMRNNLMAALNAGMPVVQASLPVRSRSSPEESSPYAAAPSPLTPTPKDREDARLFVPDQSSRKSNAGPTPKRPKPRRSISLRAPPSASVRMSASRPRVNHGFTRASTAIGNVASRQPLATISSNSSPTKSAMRKPNHSSCRKSVNPRFDQSSFGGDSIFAGTQASRAFDDADMADDLSETEI